MIPGDLLNAFPHSQFHTLPGLLDSWAALPNPNPNACMPMQGGSLYHFYDGLWYDPAERQTHDLPCERRTRYRLSQPDTVSRMESTLSPYTTIYSRLFFPEIRSNLSEMLNMFKTLRRPAIPSDFYNRDRRNRRGSYNTRYRYEVGVVGGDCRASQALILPMSTWVCRPSFRTP